MCAPRSSRVLSSVAVISGDGEGAEFTGPPRTALGVRLTELMAADQAQSTLQAGAAEVFNDDLAPKPAVRFEAVSSGYESGESFLRPLDGGVISLKRGVNLLALPTNAAPRLLASFDGCAALDTGTPPDPAPFQAALVAAMAEGQALAILVHDSAFCDGTAIAPLFAGTPLTEAAKIGFRQPFVGLIDSDGRVLEFTGPEGTQLREILTVEALR